MKMNGFLSRIISLVLVFLMLILAPLLYSYCVTEMENRRQLLNEVTSFLDVVTDKKSITNDDMNEFYMKVASYGMVLDVQINRLVKTATLEGDGNVNVTYIAADDISLLNQKDVVQIKLKEKSQSAYQKILSIFIGVDDENYSLTMAEMVH
jgi:outer membrane lipoprotein-sorting protein